MANYPAKKQSQRMKSFAIDIWFNSKYFFDCLLVGLNGRMVGWLAGRLDWWFAAECHQSNKAKFNNMSIAQEILMLLPPQLITQLSRKRVLMCAFAREREAQLLIWTNCGLCKQRVHLLGWFFGFHSLLFLLPPVGGNDTGVGKWCSSSSQMFFYSAIYQPWLWPKTTINYIVIESFAIIHFSVFFFNFLQLLSLKGFYCYVCCFCCFFVCFNFMFAILMRFSFVLSSFIIVSFCLWLFLLSFSVLFCLRGFREKSLAGQYRNPLCL